MSHEDAPNGTRRPARIVRARDLPRRPDDVERGVTVFCDETGTHDCEFFGWGSIWCPTDRVAELEGLVDDICARHSVRGELGWKYATSRARFHEAIVEAFFERPWLCFQSLLVRKDDMRIFGEDHHSVAFRKLLCTLLTTQVSRFDALPGGPRSFELRVDEVGETTRALTRQELRILLAAIRKRSDGPEPMVTELGRVDSRTCRGIQLADLLVGALRSAWEGNPPGTKGRVCDAIATHLGWDSLRATTHRNLKFNVWLHRSATGHDLQPRPLHFRFPDGDPTPLFDSLRQA
jgi:hypothetical protein